MSARVSVGRKSKPSFPQRCVMCMQVAQSRVDMSHDMGRTIWWLGGWNMLIAEGYFSAPVCRRHWTRVAFDFWLNRGGLIAAGTIGIAVYLGWIQDMRPVVALQGAGLVVWMAACLGLAAMLIFRSRPWISSEVRGDVANFAFRNPAYASAFMQANAGEVRGYWFSPTAGKGTARSSARRRKVRRK